MALLRLLVLILMFNEVIVGLDALTCPKGHKVSRGGDHCDRCPDGYYQPEDNDSLICKICTTCQKGFVKQKCTKETDTICQCHIGFTSWQGDTSICICDIGFGLDSNQGCSECDEGYFNTKINSPCKKWKDCKSAGVEKQGTKTSDVICKDELKSQTPITTPSTSNKIVSLRNLTTQRPQEGTQTQEIHNSTTTASSRQVTSKGEGQPYSPSNTGNHIGMALLIFGIAGLLLLTAVTCKLHITPCWQKTPTVRPKDSFCRRPVEESGDGSQSSLKQTPEEP